MARHDEACDAPTRPLRLFERPEPIETLAEVPDGPPLRFRWRRVLHEVAAIEGPERIAAPWWRRPGAPTRDDLRAEDALGRRFWLYREGLYGRETTQAKWFVHGAFGRRRAAAASSFTFLDGSPYAEPISGSASSDASRNRRYKSFASPNRPSADLSGFSRAVFAQGSLQFSSLKR